MEQPTKATTPVAETGRGGHAAGPARSGGGNGFGPGVVALLRRLTIEALPVLLEQVFEIGEGGGEPGPQGLVAGEGQPVVREFPCRRSAGVVETVVGEFFAGPRLRLGHRRPERGRLVVWGGAAGEPVGAFGPEAGCVL
ncbi:hypothetical protein [Amycolatopsis nalaikhensis]|uniref:Uncharacterized protein n=1 Tax=Amycolatopsis nalaikhensis TaxID=715472 RepID=A0ABY8Y0Y3_9PSEU|nr:hypothetical protein [Amycolatopsis sp. 2-2]WIV61316.1 hypothetical protein QP939_23285 [Amycolatopsis sp. 2-2]